MVLVSCAKSGKLWRNVSSNSVEPNRGNLFCVPVGRRDRTESSDYRKGRSDVPRDFCRVPLMEPNGKYHTGTSSRLNVCKRSIHTNNKKNQSTYARSKRLIWVCSVEHVELRVPYLFNTTTSHPPQQFSLMLPYSIIMVTAATVVKAT
jgi:hypothetical protein